jgi:hypothetical protein
VRDVYSACLTATDRSACQHKLSALDKAFRHFDKDSSGFLDKAEFKKVLVELGTNPMSGPEFKALWKTVDENKDGKVRLCIVDVHGKEIDFTNFFPLRYTQIDYAEFIQWLCL